MLYFCPQKVMLCNSPFKTVLFFFLFLKQKPPSSAIYLFFTGIFQHAEKCQHSFQSHLLTESGAKFIFYQKLYETCMNNKHFMEDSKIETITVLEERFGLPSNAFVSRGEPEGFNPSKTSIKKSKDCVTLNDLCWRQ